METDRVTLPISAPIKRLSSEPSTDSDLLRVPLVFYFNAVGLFVLLGVALVVWPVVPPWLATFLASLLLYFSFVLVLPARPKPSWVMSRQLILLYLATVATTWATDFLMGLLVGLTFCIVIDLWNMLTAEERVPLPYTATTQDDKFTIAWTGQADDGNWADLSQIVLQASQNVKLVVLDLTHSIFVEQRVLERLHELETDLAAHGKHFAILFPDSHLPLGWPPVPSTSPSSTLH